MTTTPMPTQDTDLAEPRLLRDRLDLWAAVKPDQPCLTFGDRTFTWAQWRERVLRLAGALRSAGVARGDRIATFDLNHLAIVELTMAAASIGAATVIANFRIAPDQLRYVLEDSRPVILFHGADLAGVVAKAEAETLVPQRFAIGGEHDEYEPFLAAGAPVDVVEGVDPDDVCIVRYTSGTTGRPKGVELTQRNINAHSGATNKVWGMVTDDVSLVAMPLFHVGGTCYFQAGIFAGAASILVREATGAALAQAVAAGATHAFLVPAVIQGALAGGAPAIAAFAPLRTLAYGASPMPLPMLAQALEAWPQMRFFQVYGMTEVAGVTVMLVPEAHRDAANPQRLVSAGKPLPGVEVRVVDPVTLEDVPAGESGEIWFRTAQAMKGYLNQPDATAEAKTADGFIRSGDIGKIDEDGYVYVIDRLKDMIITGGENVYSPEVENVLNAHPDVAEGVIVGVPHPKWVETVKAFVVRAPGTAPTEQDIIAFCRERLAGYQCPTSVDFVDELPRNATGKILKRDLRQPYWENHDRNI
jgi:acyl-CoA synthetase (AMP-forming)/AMP-acid ligase II